MRAFVIAVMMVCALPAFAVTYGDIDVDVRKEFGAPLFGHYFEQRFQIVNRSRDPHTIRISVDSTVARGGTDRATRTFQIPAKSETIVGVPFLVTGYYAPGEATVTIDGSEQPDHVMLTQQSAWEQNSNPNVLASRSVRYATPSKIDVVRPDVAPSEWSGSWLQYGRFHCIAVTAADWMQLPPAAQTAIDRWTFGGGLLVFVDRPDPMPVVSIRSQNGRYGLGRILVFESNGLLDENLIVPSLQWRSRDDVVFNSAPQEVPLLDDDRMPVRGLFVALVAFAVIGGPVNLFLLAKKNRRMWIFATLPLFAIVTSFLLVGATIANEGWIRTQRSSTITYLDETLGKAATLGWTGFYSTVSPRGQIRFLPDTELRSFMRANISANSDTTWDDGQRLFGSWVGTRVPTYFVVHKSEPRRERLAIHANRDGLLGVNGLGSHLESVYAADANGNIFEAKNVAPGRAFQLARSKTFRRVHRSPTYEAELMQHIDTWALMLPSAQKDPTTLLVPGTYVAVLRDSPFVERAFEGATETTRRGVVFGVSRLEGGSDAR